MKVSRSAQEAVAEWRDDMVLVGEETHANAIVRDLDAMETLESDYKAERTDRLAEIRQRAEAECWSPESFQDGLERTYLFSGEEVKQELELYQMYYDSLYCDDVEPDPGAYLDMLYAQHEEALQEAHASYYFDNDTYPLP